MSESSLVTLVAANGDVVGPPTDVLGPPLAA